MAGAALALSCALLGVRTARAEPSDLDPTIGYNYGEVETARHMATAGAQRALSSSIGALFVNPANVANSNVYHVGAFAQIWPEARRQSYGAAASDSIISSTSLAAAAGATYNVQDNEGIDRQWTDVRFALAMPVSEALLLGVGGHYLSLLQDGDGPLGSSRASEGLRDESIVAEVTFDAGITIRPSPEFAFALVGTSLTDPSTGFLPTTFGGGIGYSTRVVALSFDLVEDFTTWDEAKLRAMTGVDALLADHYGLRFGYRYDQGADSHALSAGAGYIDRAFQIELGARRVVSGDVATSIGIGFVYHLEAAGLEPTAGETF